MKKHFLILMLMALLPMAGFALTLDGSKFSASNIDYGTEALPAVIADGYTLGTHFTVVADRFYTSNTGEGETLVGAGGANLKVANNGQYFIKVEGLGDYDGQVVYVDFWIKGIPVTIDFDEVTKTFGDADADHPITYALTKKGAAWVPTTEELTDLGLTVSRASGENVVTVAPYGYAYSYEWTNKNYTVTRATGDAHVYKIAAKDIAATATITAWQGNVVYTGKKIYGEYTVKDKAEGGIVLTAGTDYTVSAATTVAGSPYAPTITFQGNYTGYINVAPEKSFNVTAAPIVVGVEDLEAVYDGATNYKNQTAAAAGKFTYSGIVGDDVVNAAAIKATFTAPTSVVAKKDAIDAGEYELTISGGSAAGNYVFSSYMPGKLTVKKADLKLKAANATKAIGDDDPAFTLDYAGTLAISGVTFTREPGETAGEYKITPVLDAIVIKASTAVDAKVVTNNYNVTADDNKGKLTIGATKIYVTIKDAEKFYGQEDPEFTYTVTGLKAGDELAAFEITREPGERPYSYSMTATVANPNPDKYSEVVVANGIFTIKKAQLEFTFTGAQSVKLNPTAEEKTAALNKSLITVAGINNSDVAADLYGLSYNDDVDFANDNTDDDGVVITLDGATKKLLTENATDYFAKDLYEIVAGNPKAVVLQAYGKLIVGDGTWDWMTLKRADKADIDDTAIGGKNDAAAQIKKHAGETIGIDFGTYEMLPEKWYPLVFPFETTVADISRAFNYAVVNVLNKANTDPKKISFKLHMGTIPANTPFVVKVYGSKANDYKVDMANAFGFASQIVAPSDYAAVTTADAVDASGVKFIGTYTGKTDGFRSNQYYFSASADYNQYYQGNATNTTYLRPLGAYLEVPSNEAGARIIELEEADGTITAIQVARTDNGAANNAEGWYTIGGVKLQGAPTKKGVYIQNGKKVIVK